MTSRSTRNKLRFQSVSAVVNLKKAQIHLVQLAALAGDTSPYINDNLPVIIVGLKCVIDTLEKFDEGL